MLTSLLPGIRDLRVPLVTGYLLMLDFWTLIGDPIPDRDANRFVASLYSLTDVVEQTGTLAAITFGSYLAGTILEIWRLPYIIRRPKPKFGPKVWFLPRLDLSTSVIGRWLQQYEDPSQRPLDWIGDRLDALVRHRDLTADELLRADVMPGSFNFLLTDTLDHLFIGDKEFAQLSEAEQARRRESASQSAMYDAVKMAVLAEFRLLTTRLQIEREPVYNDYDRLRAEAALRFSLFLPMLSLVVIAGFRWAPVALLLVVVPFWLLGEGWRKQRLAESKVWDSLTMGFITSPTIEALHTFVRAEGPGDSKSAATEAGKTRAGSPTSAPS